MKRLILVTTCLAAALPLFGQSSKDILAKHWQTSKEFTIAVAEAMPAENYDFKPNPEEMCFGKLMVHIAMANNSNFALVSGLKAPVAPQGIAAAFKENAKFDKAATVQFLRESFEFCTNALNQATDEQLQAMTGPAGRQLIGIERLWAYFTHTAHHRGQAEVYMRVKNVKPPAYKF